MQTSILGQRYFGVPHMALPGRRVTDSQSASNVANGGGYSSFGAPLAPAVSAAIPGGVVRVLIVDAPGPALDRLVGVVRAYAGFQLLPPVVYGLEYDAELVEEVRHQTPDVLVMDTGMGDASVAALIRACCAASPKTEILLRTHVGNDERVLACIEAGASGYFFKDAAAEWIVACVLALRGGGALISPGIARRVMSRFPLAATGEYQAVDGAALTEQQVDVLRLVACGTGLHEISDVLALPTQQVLMQIKSVYRALACTRSV
jgi:DNA-binding NarL/FixJ family response regulator